MLIILQESLMNKKLEKQNSEENKSAKNDE
jgi:hypothetical protein